MDYKKEIQELLEKINDKWILRKIYTFVRVWTEELK